MRFVRALLFCTLMVALAVPAGAASRWVDFGAAQPYAGPSVDLLDSGFDGATLTFEFPGLVAEEVETKGGAFTRLEIPGYYHMDAVGLPRLPVVREYLEVPHGSNPRLTVVSAEYVDTTLAELGLSEPVEPAQPSIVKLPGAREAARFAIDRGAYAENGFGPDVAASLAQSGQIRAHRYVEVEIYPVQYNPADGSIRYLTSIELRVDFDGADAGATRAALDRYASPDFDAFAKKHFLNARDFRTRALTLPIGYLVITYDDYYEEIETYAGLRHRLGYETTVTKLSEIPGGTTATDIQDYIKNAYTTWATPPTFVLLVGDTGQMPYFSGTTGTNGCDLYYACMDEGDDWHPDLYVGRFSCDSEADVTLLANKSTKYVRFALSSTPEDWADECTFMASSDNYTVSEGTHNYVIENWVEPAGYDVINKRYSVTYSATTQQCIDDINAGISMLTYSGHGSTNSWADGPPMSASQVQALTNVDMLPMVQSYACITGSFSSACFGETWTCADNGGVLFLGASNNSLWTEDDVMEKAVYEAWFGNDYTWVRGMFNEGLWAVDQSSTTYDRYYYEMYTVFGDPALDPWTAVPGELDVTYASAFPVGGDVFSIDVGTTSRDPVENALVCLHMDGQVYETAYTDANGHADITLTTPPEDVGMMDVWVSKHNLVPYSGAVEVIVPVTYTIVPSSVPINKATAVTATVWDSAGMPLPDVEIEVDGWGIEALVETTDAAGEAHFTVAAPYGEDLTIVGSELSQSYNCFEDVIPVTGAVALTTPDIDASVPSIGLSGSLTPHYEGLISGTAVNDEFTLYAVGCGLDESASSGMSSVAEITATPTSTGTVNAAIAKAGYEIYLEDIGVEVVYGQLAGEVYESERAEVEGARVKGYAAGADTSLVEPVFSVLSGTGGAYSVEDDLEVGYYDVYVLKFGYEPYYEEVFVQYGANDADFYLEFAPSGVVSGYVTETGTGVPLEASVKVYRSDNMELYAEVTSDTLLGGYYEVELPYFNYMMNVRAYHHIPESRAISVSGPLSEDFVLDTTLANILVIDDPATARETFKVDKTGAVLDVWKGSTDRVRSASQISADLVELGYDVTEETVSTTDPGTWMDYDFLVSSSGDNTSPVASGSYRTALEDYVANGGKLIVEGGEVAYDSQAYPGYPTFCENVLHVLDWEHDSSGNLTVYDSGHPVTTFPNVLTGVTFTYENYGDQDASIPTSDAVMVCAWSSYSGSSSVIVYDDNPDPASGQIVFFEFDYLAGESAGVKALLENAVTYLMTQEAVPTGAMSGQVCLEGMGDHSGIKVTVYPGGNYDHTDASGYFEIEGLYTETYSAESSKDGWSTGVVDGISVIEGQTTGGVTMLLYPVTEAEECSAPSLAIPDNTPAGVTDTFTMLDDLSITDIEVYVDVTHTYIGDLYVELTSPSSTTVRLHNGSGSSSDNIVGWYDTDLTVDGPGALSDFSGEQSAGEWELWVSDNAGLDTGTLNEWCVHVYSASSTDVPEGDGLTPSRYVLEGISPNPFNPVTEVSYGAPGAGHVSVRVYDVSGRLVRTLVDGEVGAGYHTAVWDGRDDRGVDVASGVYFCRMSAESYRATAKMVLLK